MAVSGIGQDGYVRIQKETTWGDPIYASMTFLPVLPGSTFQSVDMQIDNANIISSRLKQVANIGRQTVKFSLKMNLPFTLIGSLINLLLGTSSNSGVGAYTHTWLMPLTGLRIGKSFTMEVAKGSDTAERYEGCVFTVFKMQCDNKGQIIITLDGIGETYTENVARATSFSYPMTIPGNFSMAVVNVNNSELPCNSMDFTMDLNYDLENFKIGSRFIKNPVFKGIPSMNLKLNTDADRQFPVAAHAHTYYTNNSIVITSTENASGATKYKFELEIPKMKLSPETDIPFENDKLSMDLDFDCGFGGTTTGSASAIVMAEARVVDATATYP